MALNLLSFLDKGEMAILRILVVAPAWIKESGNKFIIPSSFENTDKNSKIDLLVNENLVDIVKYFLMSRTLSSSKTSRSSLLWG